MELNALARYEEPNGNTHRAARWQAVRTDSLQTQCCGSRSRVVSLETDSDENDSEVVDGQVFAVESGSSLPSPPNTSISSTSHSFRVVPFATPARGAAPIYTRLLDKPCRVCLFREPDHCKMLAPEVRAAFLTARDANYTLRPEEGYYNFPRSRSGSANNAGSARANVGMRQG